VYLERVFKLVADKKMSGKTIKDILTEDFEMSSRLISKLKLGNGIVVNNRKRYVNTVIHAGDEIVITIPAEHSDNIVPNFLDVDIVFEDEDILVVNKQAGVPVHPCQGNYYSTLANGIMYYWMNQGKSYVYRPVNRLDKDTSGLMIIAKNQYAHQQLANQMSHKVLKRTYIAFVHGVMEKDSGTIDAPIARKPNTILERMISSDGQKAVTHYQVLMRFKNYTKIEVMLETGRTHQIRVHMKHIGHPLIGDWLYGREDNNFMNRQALHSFRLEFLHPVSKEPLEFMQDIPIDMKRLEAGI